METTTVRTPTEVRNWLDRHGVTIAEWARAHGFSPAVVSGLLLGRSRGRWGQAHDAAVALGLRAAPAPEDAHPLADAIRAGDEPVERQAVEREGVPMI